jgi:hypothetical protein
LRHSTLLFDVWVEVGLVTILQEIDLPLVPFTLGIVNLKQLQVVVARIGELGDLEIQ